MIESSAASLPSNLDCLSVRFNAKIAPARFALLFSKIQLSAVNFVVLMAPPYRNTVLFVKFEFFTVAFGVQIAPPPYLPPSLSLNEESSILTTTVGGTLL